MTERATRECPMLERLALKDTVYHEAMYKMQAKYTAGVKEHGGTMTDAKIPVIEWMRQAQQEAMDQVFYFEKIIQDLENDS